ncbi:MAG: hypothetical protein K1Y02_25990 [Candidatus Hydrogenedentes bacterium]|nr:hypothetical protein [Candidatus Hydrogenedentota bacterium]
MTIDYENCQDETLLAAYGPLTATARAKVAHYVKTFGMTPYDAELAVRSGVEPRVPSGEKAVPPEKVSTIEALKAAGLLKRGSDL